MPRYRVTVELRASREVDIEVWANDEDEADDLAEAQIEQDHDEYFAGWEEIRAVFTDEMEPAPGDPECSEDRNMRALGMPELPGLAAG